VATGKAPLEADIKSAMAGDATALDTKPAKGKGKSPLEVVKGLSPKQRSALRARVEAILEALDEVEAEAEAEAESEGESEEEEV
jgi:hypothetical protein